MDAAHTDVARHGTLQVDAAKQEAAQEKEARQEMDIQQVQQQQVA